MFNKIKGNQFTNYKLIRNGRLLIKWCILLCILNCCQLWQLIPTEIAGQTHVHAD